MYVCECDYKGPSCNTPMPPNVYDDLSRARRSGDNLYIIHKDHFTDEVEIRREGDWVLVEIKEEEDV